MATDGWDIFYRLTPFKGYQWEKQSKSFNFWWGRTWFTAVSTAAGEGSEIIGSASTQHGVGSESRTCSSHLNLKKKNCERWWVFLLILFCTEVYGLQSAVQITARAGISKGQWKVRWQMLDISYSDQESALELWVMHSLEKYKSSSYVDSLIFRIAKICFIFQLF